MERPFPSRTERMSDVCAVARFLILPLVRVEHLASHILGRMAARISDDWQQMYGYPIYFLETFIDPERFRGTCHRAANWVLMGRTTGRGRSRQAQIHTSRSGGDVGEVAQYGEDRRGAPPQRRRV
jgi:hypothetical protein